MGRSGRRGNVVAVACNEGVVNVDDIDRALRMLALPARITRPRELERWVAGCPHSRTSRSAILRLTDEAYPRSPVSIQHVEP